MCAFILAILCRDFKAGQVACLEPNVNVLDSCLVHLTDSDPLLRQWSALCIAQLWDDFDEAKGRGINEKAHEKFVDMLQDPVPEVRAAVLYALGTLVGTSAGEIDSGRLAGKSLSASSPERTGLTAQEQVDIELGVAMATLPAVSDGSPQVRKELVILLSAIVIEHQGHLVVAAYRNAEEERARIVNGRSASWAAEERQKFVEQSVKIASESDESTSNPAFQNVIFSCIYKTLLDLASDPFPAVADKACVVIDFIHDQLFASPLAAASHAVLEAALHAAVPNDSHYANQEQSHRNEVNHSTGSKRSSTLAEQPLKA